MELLEAAFTGSWAVKLCILPQICCEQTTPRYWPCDLSCHGGVNEHFGTNMQSEFAYSLLHIAY